MQTICPTVLQYEKIQFKLYQIRIDTFMTSAMQVISASGNP